VKFDFKKILGPLSRLITSSLPIGGLEISDSSLRFLQVKNNSVVRASLRLPPKIIQDGVLKDARLFTDALRGLHQQINDKPKPINVILIIPSALIYAQSFSVPILEKKQMSEAIDLNLQMLSPNDIDKSYYDYQEISENKSLGTVDLLGAFVKGDVIDDYKKIIKASGFNIIAIEFAGLALTRLIKQRWTGLTTDQRYLVVSLDSSGVLMLILKNGNLYFNHFTPWKEIVQSAKDSEKFEFKDIKEFFSREVQRVLNFYLGRFGNSLQESILISPSFNYEIVKLLSEEFKLKIRNLAIAELPKLRPTWFAALGAGLRGLVSRSKDTEISLTQTEAQTEYYFERGLHFLAIWRNIALSVLVFLLIAFTATATFFRQEAQKLENKTASEFSIEDARVQIEAQKEISYFNDLVDSIAGAVDQESGLSFFMSELNRLAGETILLTRINHNIGALVSLAGVADSQQDAIAFKKRLDSYPDYIGVDLPLSNIRTELNGTITFSLTFKVASEETGSEAPTEES